MNSSSIDASKSQCEKDPGFRHRGRAGMGQRLKLCSFSETYFSDVNAI
jgi:hypothetical protein